MGRPGRPRNFGVERHPGGSVVRHVWDAGQRFARSVWERDATRAAMHDPRDGSFAGRLELLGTMSGGINRFERLAGERFAEVITSWRRQCSLSPNPNAPAANLQGGNGSTALRDREITDSEQDRITNARLNYEGVKKVICNGGREKPTLRMRVRGQKVWDILEAIFICDQNVDADSVKFARKHGLKPLVFHFHLTGNAAAD